MNDVNVPLLNPALPPQDREHVDRLLEHVEEELGFVTDGLRL